MYRYGQYCPVARAAEIVADRWTVLIIRELLADVTHFNELERGLPHMSRSLLAERLRRLMHLECASTTQRFEGGSVRPLRFRKKRPLGSRPRNDTCEKHQLKAALVVQLRRADVRPQRRFHPIICPSPRQHRRLSDRNCKEVGWQIRLAARPCLTSW